MKEKCPICGTELEENDRICSKCGCRIIPDEIEDTEDSYTRGSRILSTLFLLVIVWMILCLCLGLISAIGGFENQYNIILALCLTILIYLGANWKTQ